MQAQNLKNKMEMIIMNCESIIKYAYPGKETEVREHYIKIEMENAINRDLMARNPEALLDEYTNYFIDKSLPYKEIKKGEEFYRGRIGCTTIQGAIGGHPEEFNVPYYGTDIKAPPPVYASSGRFNKEGTSYLYLADNIETCLAEVHLQVGQVCSIGTFRCKKDVNLINLSKFDNNIEMKIWLSIITQPVHSDIKHKYNITRFLAEVFKQINDWGIYFDSIQSNGHNIVCYHTDLFDLIPYSEKVFVAKKIKYDYEPAVNDVQKYAQKNDTHNLNNYNLDRERETEEKFKYFLNWIEHEKRTNSSSS